MAKATGKAQWPHDTSRPSAKAVKLALAKDDMDALKLALTPRQRAFCEEYIMDFKGQEACIRAGYSPKCAARQAYLLHMNLGIQTYIDHLRRSREQKIAVADADYVVAKITTVMNAEKTRDSDILRGAELLAKILGMLKDRTEISGPDGEAIRVQNERVEQDARAMQDLFRHLSTKKTTLFLEKPSD